MVSAPEVIDAPERHDHAEAGEGDDDGDSPRPPPTPTRRVRDGYDRLEHWVGLAIVATCVVYVFIQLGPSLVLRNTTITGGDTGAHVWFPDFLIDHFLPWRVAGWSNDFYAGFPAGQFYFPFPAVLIALLDVVLPYNIAFKLVTVLGPLAAARRRVRVRPRHPRAACPTAPMLAVAATGFLFFKDGGDSTMTFDFHIMGGNLAEHVGGRVLVHDRGRARRSSSWARWRARSTVAVRSGCPRCSSRSRSRATSSSRSSRCTPASSSGW